MAAALKYAARGWRVFPLHTPTKGAHCSCGRLDCQNVGKHPRTRNGLKDASNREPVVRAWWQRWPQANIGVVTGQVSGLVALDIDSRHSGLESLATLLKRAEAEMPTTLAVKTGGGGVHLLFRHPGPDRLLRNVQRLDGLDGLDVRGDGGYIVAAPSLHVSGERYAWQTPLGNTPLADLPDWLLAILTKPRGGASDASTPAPHAEHDRGLLNNASRPYPYLADVAADTADFWLRKALEQTTEGNRNGTGFWLACQLRDAGLSEAEAMGVMADYAARTPAGQTAYYEREAYASLRQAYREPSREPARSLSARLIGSPASVTGQAWPAPDGWGEDSNSGDDHRVLADWAGPESPEPPDAVATANGSGRASAAATTTAPAKAVQTRFRLLSVEEVLTLPAQEWLIHKVLPADVLSVVFGEYGSGKSFLTLDLALCVATGRPWHGHKVQQGSVIYVAGEGLNGMRKRLRAWQIQHKASGPMPLYMLGSSPQLLRPQDVAAFMEAARAVPDLRLVVIDTLARALVGGDENSQKDMGLAVATADYIRAEFGCHVLFVHHKPNATEGGSARSRTRGSSALPGGADTLIDVQKDGKVIRVYCRKQKDEDEFRMLRFDLRTVMLDEAATETSCVLVQTESRFTEGANTSNDPQARMVAALAALGGGAPFTDWQREAEQRGVPRSTFAYHLPKLEANVRVINDGGTWMLGSPS